MTTHDRYNLYRQLSISRRKALRLGQETAEICKTGVYTTLSGVEVDFTSLLSHAIKSTVSYPDEEEIAPPESGSFKTVFEVRNETTLAAVRRLNTKGFHPVALNMASPTRPGGGFLSGAVAQEEYLCRSSALYPCIVDNPMYSLPIDPFGYNHIIYSPDVPIIRDDRGNLLETVQLYSVLTCAAVNAGTINRQAPEKYDDIPAVMESRIERLLGVAAKHGHNSLVLGAWGCGVFENDGEMIASLFKTAFDTTFKNVFAKVIFAIADWSLEEKFIGPFLKSFK